jgi:hypothetical protein
MPRNIMREFRLDEISAVDRPAQAHAKFAIAKRHAPQTQDPVIAATLVRDWLAKVDEPGAKTFDEVLAEREAQRQAAEVTDAMWPLYWALQDSVTSIIADASLDAGAKKAQVQATVDSFMTALRGALPDVEAELAKLLKKQDEDPTMPKTDAEKLADLEKQHAETEKQLQRATALATLTDAQKAHLAALPDDAARDAFITLPVEKRDEAVRKAAESDEVLTTVDGQTLRKSVVGEAMFSIVKSQDARLRDQATALKAETEKRVDAELRKRVSDEFAHLPGTEDERFELLKAAQALPEAARKTLEEGLKKAETVAAGAFSTLGHGNGQRGLEVIKGGAAFEKRVTEVQARDKCTKTEAMARAAEEFPADYDAYQAAADAAA